MMALVLDKQIEYKLPPYPQNLSAPLQRFLNAKTVVLDYFVHPIYFAAEENWEEKLKRLVLKM